MADPVVPSSDLAGRRRALLRQLLTERGASGPRSSVIERHPETAAAPLSFSQRRLWLFEQMVPGTAVYNLPAVVRVTGVLDHEMLERCLNVMVERHAVLRTTFTMREGEDEGEPVQIVTPFVPERLPIHDLSTVAADERQTYAERVTQQEIERPFDLATGPVLRSKLLRLSPIEHVLVLTVHHIAGDAWSWDVLIGELAAAYRGNSLDPLAIGYADYTRWQRKTFDAGAFDGQLTYWRARLGDASRLELPVDRPRPARPSFRGEVVRFALPAEIARAVRGLGQAEGATMFVATLAAFAVLLHRWCRQSDIVVGTPVAGRTNPEVEPLVGFFVNTLLIRTVLTGESSFRAVLEQVARSVAEGLTNQDIPLETILAEVRAGRTDDSAPVFQVMFGYRQEHQAVTVGDVRFEHTWAHTRTAKRDLTLHLLDSGDRIEGQIEFSTDLFDTRTVELLAARYQQLLAAVADSPGASVADLPVLLPEETRRIADGNATHVRYEQAGLTIHELLERQAELTPAAPAVRCGRQRLTYAELNQQANQVAHLLIESGIGPEVPVGLCLRPSVELVVAVFGILKAGGAYVPVDPDAPATRRAGIYRDAGVRVVLSAAEEEIGSFQTVRLGDVSTMDEWPAVDPGVRTDSANAAYVLYTSGSTGKPKGVVVEHRQVVNYTLAMLDRLDLRTPLSYAMVQPLTVDSCLTMLIPPLCTGGELHVIDKALALDADAMADYCQRHAVDCLKIAPAHLVSLSESPRFADLLPRRRLVVGGEASNWKWLWDIHELNRDCRVYNHYGPTEATVGVLTLPIDSPPDDDFTVTPLGVPIANTQVFVLDSQMRQVPFGVSGELYIGGANLARCYAGRPDLTALAFVPNPFDQAPGSRLYRTGDIVKVADDGTIRFLGRADDQVKIRGFRVELGEIESLLRSQPSVRDAVVAVRADGPGDQRVVAYLVTDDGEVPPVEPILREHLPAHMVPSAFAVVDAIPLTPHGKVDRKALPPVTGPILARGSHAEPADGVERQVAEIWQRLLGVERVGVDDNFFDLGGHSLLLVHLHQRLQGTLGGRFDLIELFRATTVRAQARLLVPRRNESRLQSGHERGKKQSAQLARRRKASRAREA